MTSSPPDKVRPSSTPTHIDTPSAFVSTVTPFVYPEARITILNSNLVRLFGYVEVKDRNKTLGGDDRFVIYQVVFSPDGRLIAATGSTGVYMYKADHLEEIYFKKTNNVATSIAFSPDGKTIAVGQETNSIEPLNLVLQVWRTSDGSFLTSLGENEIGVESVAYSPDGQFLAASGDDSSVRIWKVSDGSLFRTLNVPFFIRSINFSPDGKYIFCGSSAGMIKVFDVMNGKFTQVIGTNSEKGLTRGNLSPDGQIIALFTEGNSIRLYRVVDGKLLMTLQGFIGYINSVAFSHDGQLLASAGSDRRIRLWQVSNGKLLGTLVGHDNVVNSVAFSPDDKFLISGSTDGTLRLWGVTSGK
jgi:WD40 repeat protein